MKDKAGYIDKQGKYIVNPQYSVPKLGGSSGFDEKLVLLALAFTSDLGRLSFSEGRALVNVGDSSMEKAGFGYADNTGKIVINPQFKLAFPFYGDLAVVMFDRDEFGWIDRDGKIIWRETKETPAPTPNLSMSNSNNMNTAVVVNSNITPTTTATTNPPPPPEPPSQRTGRLTTDSNLRSDPNKDAASLGIHFKGAKFRILDETSFTNEKGEPSTWYKIHVIQYGCSVNANLGCSKNTPNDADEGWVNAKVVLLD